MQNLSFSRLLAVIKCYLYLHGRRLIWLSAAAFLLVTVPVLLGLTVSSNYTGIGDGSIFIKVLSVLGVYMLTCGALIVSDLSDSGSRMQLFLLPASRLEKFLCRCCYLLIVVPLAIVLGLVAGDAVQMLLCAAAGFPTESFTLNAVPPLIFLPHNGAILAAVVNFIFVNSLFFLSGTFFRRHAWIKSCIFLMLFFLFVLACVFLAGKMILDFVYGEGNYSLIIENYSLLCIVLTAVFLALAVFNYWAAFRIYSRMQAANNTWHNF